MIAAGAERKDIHEDVRVMQFEAVFSLCYLLEGAQAPEPEPELAAMAWRLMRTDEQGAAIGAIGAIHESLLETDPSGRERRRGSADEPDAAR